MVDAIYSLDQLLKFTEGFHKTSSVDRLKDKSVVFVKSKEWLWVLFEKIKSSNKEVFTFCNAIFWNDQDLPPEFKQRARPLFLWDLTEKFILFHNHVNQHRQPESNVYASDCKIHPSVIIGSEGMRYIRSESGPIKMKHMGNVVISSGVEIGPFSIVNRATLDSTVIGKNTKIGALVSIGHNVIIEEGCFITPQVTIGGSVHIGENCWIGMGATIRDNVRICEDVRIGMGSFVVKDILKAGTYFGSPAERKGDWDGSL